MIRRLFGRKPVAPEPEPAVDYDAAIAWWERQGKSALR